MSVDAIEENRAPNIRSLSVKPVEPTIGAEISGIDLRQPLSITQRDEIKALLLKHRVLFFRDQPINHDQQIAFARQFGKIYPHPSTRDETKRFDPGTADSHRISAVEQRKLYKATAGRWHTDTSWLVHPAWGALLREVDIPPLGGDTIWADGHAVYESLNDELKEKIADLYVVHDFQSALKRVNLDYPIVAHPLVRTHPETGEKILWLNFSQYPSVIGWDRADSAALVTELERAYSRPEFHVRFKWSKHALAFWDNRAGLHYPVTNYGDYPRLLERVLIEDFDAPAHY
ncbi:TauD/TfdA dioxygenase family protein [Xylophilus sp.]|uniref:TauD/TfdA dioxygenase family protein n=1 Tax=Xylophilus sp. TaxID=2653893 RepID=UPI0013BB74B2|nr:TauD/TfdA family dioxygenase [Xylophilus sp.]KAF1042975.1 MAG: Alpha-ketoglutarate-dependent taurine dioxygenase [Xylophilus sp.]